jgi:HPt (histidine-containing phosphotransfer) domain-containing protein
MWFGLGVMMATAIERGLASQLAEDLPPEDVRLVLDVFRADVTRLSQVMRVAAAAGDGVNFRRVAHSLAGASGAVGASALEQACRLAMTRADIGPAEFPATSTEINRLCTDTLTELAAFVAALDARA